MNFGSSETHVSPAVAYACEWKKVEDCLCEVEAQELKERQAQEFTSLELKDKVLHVMARGESLKHERSSTIILGPSAAGKSWLVHDSGGKVRLPPGALHVDGAYLRDCSKTWADTKAWAKRLGLAGFSNYFSDYAQRPSGALKNDIIAQAVQQGTNLIITDTASDFKKLCELADLLTSTGYDLHWIAVFACKSKCEARGRTREVDEGKRYSSTNWKKIVQAILDMQKRLGSNGINSHIQIINNTDGQSEELILMPQWELATYLCEDGGPAPEVPVAWTHQEAPTKWCEAMSIAGCYATGLSEDKASNVAVSLSDYSAKVSHVIFQPQVASSIRCEFHVESSSFFAINDQGFGVLDLGKFNHIQRCIEWNESAPWGQQAWKLMCKIDGHSVSVAITEDEHLLKSLTTSDGAVLNFSRGGLEAFTAAEVTAAQHAVRVLGPKIASAHLTPKALVILAPSAGGKTSMCQWVAPKFGMDLTDVVWIDGSILRSQHEQFRCVVANGASNAGVWHCAWQSIKNSEKAVKHQIFKLALKQSQDIIYPDTGNNVKELLDIIQQLKTAGYFVSVVCLYAPPMEIMTRGIRREVQEGKCYNRNVDKIQQSWKALEPSIQAANGYFKVVHNRTGMKPLVISEGRCFDGCVVPRLLWDDLTTAILDIPLVDIAIGDVRYLAEGNTNIVVRYAGDDFSLHGKVLRFTKESHHRQLDTAKFQERIVRHVFEDFVEVASLVKVKQEVVASLDKVLLFSRPEHRRDKHLDTSAFHSSGNIFALLMRNLVPSTVLGHPVCTFELKPKCGIKELSDFPSRYQMLQVSKMQKGNISEFSEYDPVDLFSEDPQRVLCALKAAMRTPQNNLRAFIGHQLQLDAEHLAKSCSDTAALDFEKSLKNAQMPDLGNLLQYLTLALSSPQSRALKVIRRAQCWAAGETAHVVNQLLSALHKFSPHAVDELTCVRSFESAIDGVQDLPCDESGMKVAVAAMQQLLNDIRATGGMDPTLEKETIRWICRFLLGRTAFDVSLCVNLVRIDLYSLHPKLEQQLTCDGFSRLQLSAEPVKHYSMWVRIVVVDTDMKKAHKIPFYATELDDLQITYTTWRSSCSTSHNGIQGKQVGGHDGKILFRGNLVWKRWDHRFGDAEVEFLQTATDSQVLRQFVPHFRGIESENGCNWIVMDNLLDNMLHPAIVDLKIGRRTWASNASPDKVQRSMEKAKASTSWSMGFRLVGAQYLNSGTGCWETLGHKYASEVSTEKEMKQFFFTFF